MRFLVYISLLAVLFYSCKKDKLLTDPSAKVSFSQDAVLFDTVFTTVGSATKNIRVINKNRQKIRISSISLQNSVSSQFILNVDGSPGKSFSDIEIAANDSIFIFIQVNVNPTSSNSPLVIQDKILFSVNGNEQSVSLEAWGQDAYYHYPTNTIKFKDGSYLPYSLVSVSNNTVVNWVNDKPHVIYGWLVVDSTQTLLIDPGVKVHFHQNAGLWVYRYGTLNVQGAKGNEVVFLGDRLEPYMQDVPGQWDRIWINEGSVNNQINYAIIKNGFIGIQAGLYPFYDAQTKSIIYDYYAPRRLKLTNAIIRNVNSTGLYTESFNIAGGNNVVVNCKEYCAKLTLGGNYSFVHCTFANYWDKSERKVPTLYIENYPGFNLDTCYFGNCIIDGSGSNEIEFALTTAASSNYQFSNSMLRTTNNTSNNSNYYQCRINQSSNFTSVSAYDFSLGMSSAAINFTSTAALNDAAKFPIDILGTSRITSPDAGAYEK